MDSKELIRKIVSEDPVLPRALELKSMGYTPRVEQIGRRTLFFMEKGDEVVFMGELSYALVKEFSLNIPPSRLRDKLVYYMEKGWRIKCDENGYASAKSPEGKEEYVGKILDEIGVVPKEIVEALDAFGYSIVFENGRVKVKKL